VALETRRYMDALISHAMASGHFSSVNSTDIGSVPTNEGISVVVWPRSGSPIPERSGLASTSVLIPFMVRLFRSMKSDPLGEIDPSLIDATDALLNAYSGDFTLGGIVAEVDLLGQYGDGLSWDSGYIDMGDDGKFRVVDITVPLVINDVWTQSE
jgi:hypothetical protein